MTWNQAWEPGVTAKGSRISHLRSTIQRKSGWLICCKLAVYASYTPLKTPIYLPRSVEKEKVNSIFQPTLSVGDIWEICNRW